ncbi:MAG: hypothetical protein ACYSWO_01985 [Planctomycetota bacterium]|jgi:hypothetical protein
MKISVDRIVSAPLKNGSACGAFEFSITLPGAAEANSPPLTTIPIVLIVSFSPAKVKEKLPRLQAAAAGARALAKSSATVKPGLIMINDRKQAHHAASTFISVFRFASILLFCDNLFLLVVEAPIAKS